MSRFLSIFGRSSLNRRGLVASALFLVGAALVAMSVTPIAAQVSSPQMQQLLSPRGGQNGTGGVSSPFGSQRDNPDNGTVIIQPAGPLARQPRSMLEQILSGRAGVQLNQFGYNDLGAGRAVVLPQMGGVQEEYILGPGDEIVVTLRGQEAGEYRTFVDRSGRVILPKLNPINVAGRSFGSFRDDLAAAVQRAYVATEAFASLGSVRQIRVTVGGEVNNPGLRVMTGLASAMDAILVSSGVKKTGSLRNIHLLRGGRRINVDLYGVLRGTGAAQLPLVTDGDRIIVNPLGATVAITGPVRVPAIYELAPGRPGMTAASLIAMAGGYSVRGRYDLTLIGLGADGRTQMSSLPNDRALVRDSDVLIVRTTAEQTAGRATLQAGTTNGFSGTYAAQATRLSDMLRAPGMLGDDPYPLFAVISRRDPVSLLRTLIAVTPSAVMAGRQDYSLQSDDIVHSFSRSEAVDLINALTWFGTHRTEQDKKIHEEGEPPLLGKPDEIPPLPNSGRSNEAGAETPAASVVNRSEDAANELGTVGYYDNTSVDDGYDNGGGINSTSGLADATTGGFGGGMPGFGVDPLAGLPATRTALSGQGAGRDSVISRNQSGIRPDPAARYRRELGRIQRLADALKTEPNIVAHFLLDRLVTVKGAIRGPGTYLIGPDLPLSVLVQAAGGTLNWSDRTGIERLSTVVDPSSGQARTELQPINMNDSVFTTAVVRPGDEYRFPSATVATLGTVTLKGEVKRPGVYTIVRGERLSDVLIRAGGLTQIAYPYGAVFLRKSVAEREREGLVRAARDLEAQLTVSLTKSTYTAAAGTPALGYEGIRALVGDLRNQPALGRVSVLADPAVLATHPQSDPLMESGDILHVPQRPATITVLGEVMNVASFPVQPNVTIAEYIARAGGYSRFADQSLTFVVLPDGTAQKVEQSWFAVGNTARLPPGSTIVVPKDINPFDIRRLMLDTSQILGQLAVGVASIAILSRN